MLNPFISSCILPARRQTHPDRRAVPSGAFMTMPEREEFVKDWIQVPDEKFKQYVLDWEPRGEHSNPYYRRLTCPLTLWIGRDDALH